MHKQCWTVAFGWSKAERDLCSQGSPPILSDPVESVPMFIYLFICLYCSTLHPVWLQTYISWVASFFLAVFYYIIDILKVIKKNWLFYLLFGGWFHLYYLSVLSKSFRLGRKDTDNKVVFLKYVTKHIVNVMRDILQWFLSRVKYKPGHVDSPQHQLLFAPFISSPADSS